MHLTAQLGKAAERFLHKSFGPHLTSPHCSGENQFAYKTKRGARDLLAFLVLTWVEGFTRGKKYVLYCSDVAGAFDRVRLQRLVAKLRSKSVPERWVQLFCSWLRERPACVVVGGRTSAELVLRNMVFQGTVWGPTLWNLFYEDAARAVKEAGFTEVVFADDLNALKEVGKELQNEEALKTAAECQKKLHRWGAANQVTFEPTKESYHVVSHLDPHGEDFTLLGIPLDCQLTMATALWELVGKGRWKLKALLRSANYHCEAELVKLYTSKLLCY